MLGVSHLILMLSILDIELQRLTLSAEATLTPGANEDMDYKLTENIGYAIS